MTFQNLSGTQDNLHILQFCTPCFHQTVSVYFFYLCVCTCICMCVCGVYVHGWQGTAFVFSVQQLCTYGRGSHPCSVSPQLPRLQKVTKQVLVALEFIHSLNLIHCDLKVAVCVPLTLLFHMNSSRQTEKKECVCGGTDDSRRTFS